MSSICALSDDLLVTILSSVKTKDAVATSLLSKRWLYLWKLVPRLEYRTAWDKSGSDFIGNFLRLSKAPVLETFHLKLGDRCPPEELEKWVNTAVARHVRVLELLHDRFRLRSMLCPKSLFACKGLVVLRLQDVSVCDIPSTISLQSLKTLSLVCVRFFSKDELVHRLLSACPILETLIIRRWFKDTVVSFTIAVPTLQNLHIMQRPDGHVVEDGDYVINTPSLKTLNFSDKFGRVCSLVKMPNLVKAEIKIKQEDSEKFMGCLTSAKHLSLCLNSAKCLFKYLISAVPLLMAKPGEFFCQLEYLELCTNCSLDWLSLLLMQSPKLRVLRLTQGICGMGGNFETQWEKPSCIPECLVSSVETVEWIGYKATKAEKDVAIYILDKANHLKEITLSPKIAN